jgi:hypothetical protein
MLATGTRYTWNATGAGGAKQLQIGAANVAWSDAINVSDVEQIAIVITVTGPDPIVMRLSFATDARNPQTFAQECVEGLPAVVGTAERYPLAVKEWGQLTAAGGPYIVHRPIDCHTLKIGFYDDAGAVDAAAAVAVELARQNGSQLQATPLS